MGDGDLAFYRWWVLMERRRYQIAKTGFVIGRRAKG
jgi:hypothetical protein